MALVLLLDRRCCLHFYGYCSWREACWSVGFAGWGTRLLEQLRWRTRRWRMKREMRAQLPAELLFRWRWCQQRIGVRYLLLLGSNCCSSVQWTSPMLGKVDAQALELVGRLFDLPLAADSACPLLARHRGIVERRPNALEGDVGNCRWRARLLLPSRK